MVQHFDIILSCQNVLYKGKYPYNIYKYIFLTFTALSVNPILAPIYHKPLY